MNPNWKGLFSIQSTSASYGDGTNNNTLLKNLELRIINALMVSNSKLTYIVHRTIQRCHCLFNFRILESRNWSQCILLLSTHDTFHKRRREDVVSTARGNHLRIQIQRVQEALFHLRGELGVQLALTTPQHPNRFVRHKNPISVARAALLSSSTVTLIALHLFASITSRADPLFIPVASCTTAITVPALNSALFMAFQTLLVTVS